MERKQYSDEEVHKRISSLPPEVASLLYSPEMLDIVKRVGDKYQLHIDKIGLLEAETGEVMLGFTDAKDFPGALMESLDIDRMKADGVAQDINDQLFMKIRGAMKNAATPKAPAPDAPAEKSVVMPSSRPAPPPATVATPKPAPAPLKPSVIPAPGTVPQLDLPAPLHAADVMLSESTLSMPPKPAAPAPPAAAPAPGAPAAKAETPTPAPAPYKADPYREPPE